MHACSDLPRTQVFPGRSTKSLHNPEQCVEVGTAPNVNGVRDTKDRDGAVLTFPAPRWSAFIDAVNGGQFDR
ncbi:DUF397 domain-containing protein [Saccharopolyspora elongata]|uniref:DUF397 domain-containing protein n=2 Tax=Saccharopolyspora elongata TaxID=2530387 RepID=A0A4R4YDY2_9PSEU|nr:DUF397 domain-containing protein [Saccharopolyspora elongata]